ncbi:DUF732 domain-containing protein [Rhodococcus erythropolis]|uniref:DUF732 domain-containing protein n=1 Tax=Rhodococcus erythropolis TaxID=1833 RepID=UPI0036DED6DF
MNSRTSSKIISLALLIFVAGGAACAADTEAPTQAATEVPPAAEPNQQYLGILDRVGVPRTSDDEMIEIGRLICNNLDLGMSKEAAGLPLYYPDAEYSLGEAGTIVGAAINAYCPQHKDW